MGGCSSSLSLKKPLCCPLMTVLTNLRLAPRVSAEGAALLAEASFLRKSPFACPPLGLRIPLLYMSDYHKHEMTETTFGR